MAWQDAGGDGRAVEASTLFPYRVDSEAVLSAMYLSRRYLLKTCVLGYQENKNYHEGGDYSSNLNSKK